MEFRVEAVIRGSEASRREKLRFNTDARDVFIDSTSRISRASVSSSWKRVAPRRTWPILPRNTVSMILRLINDAIPVTRPRIFSYFPRHRSAEVRGTSSRGRPRRFLALLGAFLRPVCTRIAPLIRPFHEGFITLFVLYFLSNVSCFNVRYPVVHISFEGTFTQF